jgi:pimeloyl-ACP methyl ester carboxylesterase
MIMVRETSAATGVDFAYRDTGESEIPLGSSTGANRNTIGQMAHDAIAFIAAMDFGQVDLLGLSIGSFVAQEIVLIRSLGA